VACRDRSVDDDAGSQARDQRAYGGWIGGIEGELRPLGCPAPSRRPGVAAEVGAGAWESRGKRKQGRTDESGSADDEQVDAFHACSVRGSPGTVKRAPLTPPAARGHTARVRIIAGSFGGRPLVAPRGCATRPTADRVREALFSILGDVAALDVLDLFAGSGAFGLEALSRGAATATFVESAHPALVALRANVAALAVDDRTTLVATDVDAGLARLARDGRRYGLVFLDPPYAAGVGDMTLGALVTRGLLVPGAWVVLEHSSRDAAPAAPAMLPSRFERTYGAAALSFHRFHPEGS